MKKPSGGDIVLCSNKENPGILIVGKVLGYLDAKPGIVRITEILAWDVRSKTIHKLTMGYGELDYSFADWDIEKLNQ